MKIKIGGYQINVVEVDHLITDYEHLGEFSSIKQEIRLDKSLTDEQKKETLIHEILEAINSIYELGLEHDNQLCKLSVIIHQIINDNPNLV